MAGNKNFGKNLKRLREKKGYSQEQLAELIGLEYQSISRIETGLYFTSYDNLEKIAKVLKISIKDLFDFPETEFSKNELIELINKDISNFDIIELKNIQKIIKVYQETRN